MSKWMCVMEYPETKEKNIQFVIINPIYSDALEQNGIPFRILIINFFCATLRVLVLLKLKIFYAEIRVNKKKRFFVSILPKKRKFSTGGFIKNGTVIFGHQAINADFLDYN